MSVAALVTTPSSPSANAYVSLAEANQYHDNRPAVGTTWADASDDQKAQAILWATMLMDNLWHWNGYVTTALQALQWPRIGLMNKNRMVSQDYNTIPTEIKNACAEYARQLLTGDLAGNSEIETQGITSLRAGPVALTFKDNVTAKPVPDTVVNLIPPDWGYPRSRNRGVRQLARA